jgi:outer membrane biosynthesis protein TonB
MFMQNGYDKQHAMYNWAGIFDQDYPEKHAVFYGSPEYKRLIASGLHIESIEDFAAAVTATQTQPKPSVKSVPVKKIETEPAEPDPDPEPEPETDMPRPKKKSAAIASTIAPQSPPETEKSVPQKVVSSSLTSIIRQPVLFRQSRTPYKVHEVEKISRETLGDYIRKKMAENPELNKLFTE